MAFDLTDACANVAYPDDPDTLSSYTVTAYLDGVDATSTYLGRTGTGPGSGGAWHFMQGYYVFFLAYGGGAGDLTVEWECVAETSRGQTIDEDWTMQVKER